jgi:hypothetical protein
MTIVWVSEKERVVGKDEPAIWICLWELSQPGVRSLSFTLGDILQASDNLSRIINSYKAIIEGQVINGEVTTSTMPDSEGKMSWSPFWGPPAPPYPTPPAYHTATCAGVTPWRPKEPEGMLNHPKWFSCLSETRSYGQGFVCLPAFSSLLFRVPWKKGHRIMPETRALALVPRVPPASCCTTTRTAPDFSRSPSVDPSRKPPVQ